MEKSLNRVDEIFQIFFVGRNNNEVISIPRVMANPQLMLYKLIQFIHINVCKKLGGEIADRQTLAIEKRCLGCGITLNDLPNEPHGVLINDFFPENIQQSPMIDRIEKLLHVALQDETRFREISAFSSDHPLHSQHAFMDSFIDAAGK